VRADVGLRTGLPAGPAPRTDSGERGARRAVGVAILLVVVTAAWGLWLDSRGRGIALGAAPLAGDYRLTLSPWVVLPLALGVGVVRWGPSVARRTGWRTVLWASLGATALWAVALTLVEGPAGLTEGVTNRWEYLADLDQVTGPGAFLSTFTQRIDGFVTHVRGHPPGLLLVLWWLDRLGLGGPQWAAGLMIAGGAAAVPAVLVAAREVAGEDRARGAAPFLVLAPAAVWIATSADALFAGVAAWGVALLILATGRGRPRRDLQAVGGGLLVGLSLFLSYGLVLLCVIPLAVGVARRRIRPLLVGGLAVAAVALAFAGLGFWWFDGLQATHREYYQGIAARRPYGYFLLANLAAFAVAVGPAVVGGLAVLRDRGLWLLVGGALMAVAIADLSGLSKGEVERIWLPFDVWVGLAAAAVAVSRRPRAWLAAQAATALTVQVGVATIW
jgi:hypothetical protein